jgi:16S rRNA (adenine1518-N6/adenine1519-N6)-dimethyltransferase
MAIFNLQSSTFNLQSSIFNPQSPILCSSLITHHCFHMRAKRSLGQNFLVDRRYAERIVEAVSPRAGETIIEIGPGQGALTELLVESGARVVGVELDRELIPYLAERFATGANFRLIEADALTVDFCQQMAPTASARVVANLPYYVSTPILQRLIEQRRCLREMTLMLQREVVERITAPPGGKQYGYLSVLVQFYCEAQRLFDVPPGAFRPAPKVYSSVLRLSVRPEPAVKVSDEAYFWEVVKALFAQRRKTMLNNLRAAQKSLGLGDEARIARAFIEAELEPRRRAETLSLAETARLAEALKKSPESGVRSQKQSARLRTPDSGLQTFVVRLSRLCAILSHQKKRK